MWTRISKCQSGGKETSVNRPSNIYSIIARRQVAFLKRRENNLFFLLIRGRVGHEWCIFWVLFLLTVASQVSAAPPNGKWKSSHSYSWVRRNVWKTVRREGKKKKKQVTRKRNSWLMLPLSGSNSDRLRCLYSYRTETPNVNQTQ